MKIVLILALQAPSIFCLIPPTLHISPWMLISPVKARSSSIPVENTRLQRSTANAKPTDLPDFTAWRLDMLRWKNLFCSQWWNCPLCNCRVLQWTCPSLLWQQPLSSKYSQSSIWVSHLWQNIHISFCFFFSKKLPCSLCILIPPLLVFTSMACSLLAGTDGFFNLQFYTPYLHLFSY